MIVLFSAEVCRHLAPLLCFPFVERVGCAVLPQPVLGTCHELQQPLVLRCRRQRGLRLALRHPDDGSPAVAIDRHGHSLLLHQCHGVYDGQELPDVVRAVDGTEVKDLLPRLQINAPILHGPWITAAGGIHGNGFGRHLHGQWEHGVVAVVGRRN